MHRGHENAPEIHRAEVCPSIRELDEPVSTFFTLDDAASPFRDRELLERTANPTFRGPIVVA